MGHSQSRDQNKSDRVEIPEFDVTHNDDGTFTAVHKTTGETVTAVTAAELERKAIAKRIAISLRGGGR
jgi:hypothetical protein